MLLNSTTTFEKRSREGSAVYINKQLPPLKNRAGTKVKNRAGTKVKGGENAKGGANKGETAVLGAFRGFQQRSHEH